MTKTQIIEILDTEWGGQYAAKLGAKPGIGWGWLESEARRIIKNRQAGHVEGCFDEGAGCVCPQDEDEIAEEG